ncbi:hypothetical protein DITRI_Ditri02bG0018000 [Diplodiscus trichospermus]
MGLSKTVVEGDAIVITRKLLEDTTDLSVIGNRIEEAKDLKKTLTNCMVNHVSRKGNMAAHRLAREALFLSGKLTLWKITQKV